MLANLNLIQHFSFKNVILIIKWSFGISFIKIFFIRNSIKDPERKSEVQIRIRSERSRIRNTAGTILKLYIKSRLIVLTPFKSRNK
jgi:hypothetical protein